MCCRFPSFVAHVNVLGSVIRVGLMRTEGSTHRADYVRRPPKTNIKFEASFKEDDVGRDEDEVVRAVVKKTATKKKPAITERAPSDDDSDNYFKSGLLYIICSILF